MFQIQFMLAPSQNSVSDFHALSMGSTFLLRYQRKKERKKGDKKMRQLKGTCL